MANEKVYPKGFFSYARNENAPDWVRGSVVVNINDFKAWLDGEGKQYITYYKDSPQIRLQIADGKEGKLNITVDTWKKTESTVQDTGTPKFIEPIEAGDDLPF